MIGRCFSIWFRRDTPSCRTVVFWCSGRKRPISLCARTPSDDAGVRWQLRFTLTDHLNGGNGGAKLPLSRSYVRCAGRLGCNALGTDSGDSFLQRLYAIHQPGEFLGCDFECWRIARIDISAIKTSKCALCEPGVIRPYADQLRRYALRL